MRNRDRIWEESRKKVRGALDRNWRTIQNITDRAGLDYSTVTALLNEEATGAARRNSDPSNPGNVWGLYRKRGTKGP